MNELEISQPDGFPESVESDLERAEFDGASNCTITYHERTDTVTITVEDTADAQSLYKWLENTAEYYKENFVDATGDYLAARQLADVVHQEWVANSTS